MSLHDDRWHASHRGLLVNDVQKDFCEGGALAVPGAEEIVRVINRYIELFAEHGLPVFVTRDWHPPETSHFTTLGGKWPPHCVAGSDGAAFHPALSLPTGAIILSKGTRTDEDGYSAFEAHHPGPVLLRECLNSHGVETIYLAGIATDYCIRATALDGIGFGFTVVVLEDAVRGIDARAGDVREALDEMRRAGARLARFEEVARELASAPRGPAAGARR
ncbi:MAG TPA: isochorismatase family protein [Gemmatimonadaceae bacterium]